jgi:hypothetical protein
LGAIVRQRGWAALVAATVAVAGLVGCATDSAVESRSAGPSPEASTERVRVLYRVDLQFDGKPASPWERIQPLPFGNNVRLYLANIDAHEPVRAIAHHEPLPGAAGDQGWASLALKPGTYFVLVLPPGASQDPPVVSYHAATARFGRLVNYKWQLGRGGVWDGTANIHVLRGAAPDDFMPITGFLLRVPDKQPLVYAGTLRIACTVRGVLGDLIRECSDTSVSDESAAARLAARALGAQEPDLHRSLLSGYGRPTTPLDVGGSGLELLAVPPLKDETGIDFSIPAAAPPFVVGGSSPAILVFNLLSIAGHSVGVAASQEEARALAGTWRPCVERLARETRSLDLMALVSGASESALAPLRASAAARTAAPAVSGSGEPRIEHALAISASPRQLRLRECLTRNTFCLELAMRVTFTNLQPRRDVFDAELVYTNAWPPSDLRQTSYRLYQLPVDARSQCRTLETWCGEGGSDLLRTEAAAGINAILRAAVERSTGR